MKKPNISSESIGAIFVAVFVGLFVLANLWIGFSWPLFVVAMTIGFAISMIYPRSGLSAIIILTMIFERFFTLQTFFIGKVEYKLYPLDILMAGILLGIVGQYLFGRRIKFSKIDWTLLIFMFLNLIYFIFSIIILKTDASLAFSTFKNYAFYSLFYFIVLFLIRTKQDLQRFFNTFLIGGIAIVIFIILGIFNGEGLWSQYTPLSTGGVRILAFTHGLYMALVLFPVILYLIFQKTKNKFLYILIAIWSIGVIGSLMRHLWIAMVAIFVALYIALSVEKRIELRKIIARFSSLVVILVAVILYAVVMTPQSKLSHFTGDVLGVVSQRAASLSSVSADESFAWRSLVWNSAYKKFKANPVFGVGTGEKVYVENGGYRDFIEIRNIHNSYLAILIQLGFISFGVFAYFVWGVIKGLIKSGGDNQFKFYKFSILSVVGIYLISIPFQPYLETNLLAIFFWMSLGLARVLPEINLNK
ncbi:MAG: hypothetical protein UT50_C0001G0005 [Candidatus Moranbacteria bacterium GW2011_GWA2_39_41]|nr:MAG: hypothetical protein UT50_C0001G0005 [Candidatus Moranbacteria bacterium GW2011_GWA2_39_41]